MLNNGLQSLNSFVNHLQVITPIKNDGHFIFNQRLL